MIWYHHGMKKLDIEKLLFIEATLLVKGQLNRNDVIDRFGIAPKSATKALNMYRDQCPDQMVMRNIDGRILFKKSDTCKPCLFKNRKKAEDYFNAVNIISRLIDEAAPNISDA